MLTNKKRLYAEARLAGLNQKDSAIAAGYSPATADQSASRLEKDPDVIAHRHRVASPEPEPVPPEPMAKQPESTPETLPSEPPAEPAPPSRFDDPIEFLKSMANNVYEDPRLRLDAAKAWASFTVAKPGEKGKKEEKADAAKKVASRFATAAAPLKAVK